MRKLETLADVFGPPRDESLQAQFNSMLDGDIGGYSSEELEEGRKSLIKAAQILSPGYIPNWHHIAVADALERILSAEIEKLMILIPPQHGKTLLASNIFPAYTLGRQDESIFSCAFSITKAKTESIATQRLMESEGYKALFPLRQIPKRPNSRKGWQRNAEFFNLVGREQATYKCVGVDGQGTGAPRSIGIIDDPVKNLQDARSEVIREKVWGWYASVYSTRRNQLRSGATGKVRDVLIMTPWDEDDLHGRILDREGDVKDGGEWHVIRIPAIMDDVAEQMGRHPDDPREIGEALWPQMNPIEELLKRRETLPSVFEAMYQCRPRNPDGGIFRASWMRRFEPVELPDGIWTVSVDANFGTTGTKRDTHSYVSMQVWVLDPQTSRAFFVHEERNRETFLETTERLTRLFKRFPKVRQTLIENKANGPAIIQMMRRSLPGIIEVNPQGSKMARAGAVAPWFESGSVYIAKGVNGDEFIERLCRFPAKGTDDTVDAMSQCLDRLGSNPLERLAFLRQARTG